MSRALYLHGPYDARLGGSNLREKGPGGALLRVAAVGICGSDLHYYKDGGIGSTVIRSPFIPGHEFGGWLEEDLAERELPRGSLVAVDPNRACKQCAHCLGGHPNLCPNVQFIGAPPYDGAMTERLWVPSELIVPLPEDFSPEEAVMLEPLGVAIHAVDLARPRLLESVALVGCGPIGLLILQVLKLAGAGKVYAVDPLPHRRELAARLGAEKVGASVAEVDDWTSGEGCPLVMEATNAPEGFRDAVAAARVGGRIVLVGIPDGDVYTLPAAEARRRGLSIKFARRMGHVYPRAIELVAARKVDVLSLVSHRIGLEEAPSAFRQLADGAPGMIKTLIFPGNGFTREDMMRRRTLLSLLGASVLAGFGGPAGSAWAQEEWTLEKAAEPFKGTEVNAIFLDRPGYRAIIELLPEFEEKTGIKVNYEIVPYENSREQQVLDFSSGGNLTIALVDLVWIGEFAENGWIEPISKFTSDPAITDPNLNLEGFFPLLLDAFGSWGGEVYGLPFDNYSGLLFYNKCMLEEAGFDKPPATWDELINVYAPKLTKPEENQYAFALQSLRGETQSADSFMRVLWPFGGSLLNEEFKSNLMSPESQAGLKFRQDLMQYMPPGVVSYDHAEAVNALAQGQVAMITEWSAFYSTLTDPATSKIVDCLAVAPEPEGPAGRLPALGGFSLAVASQASEEEQKASWLFIQWATSEEIARAYVEAGGVSGRTSIYEEADIKEKYQFVEPMVASWQAGVPEFRPRFPAWPAISEIVAEWGSKMMLGEVTPEEGAQEIGSRMETILQDEGYYDGQKELLQ